MRKLILLIAVLFMIGLTSFVSAVPAAPSPICKITAEIVNVTYRQSYFQEDDGRPCNEGGINIAASYLMTVRISQISNTNNEGNVNCSNLYPVDSEQAIIYYKKVYEYQNDFGDKFVEGQTIEGNINHGGDECSSGIYLNTYPIADIESGCQNLYWIDNENKECSQKEFCGTYVYQGLQTFETKGECERAANNNENLKTRKLLYNRSSRLWLL